MLFSGLSQKYGSSTLATSTRRWQHLEPCGTRRCWSLGSCDASGTSSTACTFLRWVVCACETKGSISVDLPWWNILLGRATSLSVRGSRFEFAFTCHPLSYQRQVSRTRDARGSLQIRALMREVFTAVKRLYLHKLCFLKLHQTWSIQKSRFFIKHDRMDTMLGKQTILLLPYFI